MSASNKSWEVVVLCPNGRRVTIKTNRSSSVEQIIEEACSKHGFDPYDYNLRHLQRTLDPSSTLQYSNIPNHAQLELTKAQARRKEGSVTVNLVTDEGQRLVAEFPSRSSLYDILKHHETQEGTSFHLPIPSSGFEPFVVYSIRRFVGEELKSVTLKSLGLLAGKCMMRYNVQKPEMKQSTPIMIVNQKSSTKPTKILPESSEPSHSEKDAKDSIPENKIENLPQNSVPVKNTSKEIIPDEKMDWDSDLPKDESVQSSITTQESEMMPVGGGFTLDDCRPQFQGPTGSEMMPVAAVTENIETRENLVEERLQSKDRSAVECEVSVNGGERKDEEKPAPTIISLSDHDSLLFSLDDAPNTTSTTNEKDDFFELTVNEVRKLYQEQLRQMKNLNETPLMTEQMRQMEQDSRLFLALNRHPVTQLRICFPDRHVIQANFKPRNTIGKVMDFLRPLLNSNTQNFYLYTNFPRRVLEPQLTLVEADCIPKARLYFGVDEENKGSWLSKETLAKKSSFEGASSAVIKSKNSYTKNEESIPNISHLSESISACSRPVESTSTGAISKVTPTPSQHKPKWFKLGK